MPLPQSTSSIVSPILSFKTPLELLYSKSPSFSHLLIFGCLAYATNVHPSHKFDQRATPSIFNGYPVGQKAYKLFDLSRKKVFISQDVKFHEQIFLYSTQPNSVASSLGHQPGPIPLLTDPSTSTSDIDFFFSPNASPSPNLHTSSSSSSPKVAHLPSSPSPTPSPTPSPSQQLSLPQLTSLCTYSRRRSMQPPVDDVVLLDSSSLSSLHVPPSTEPAFASVPPSPPPLPVAAMPTPTFVVDPDSLPYPVPVPLRRSSRQIRPLDRLTYTVSSTVHLDQSSSLLPGPTKGTRYPLANYVSNHRYLPQHQAFMAKLSQVTEPRTYSEAAVHPEWKAAMLSELQTLQANRTWTSLLFPPVRFLLAVVGFIR